MLQVDDTSFNDGKERRHILPAKKMGTCFELK